MTAMSSGPDLSLLTPTSALRGDSPKDTELLRQLHNKASEFLSGHSWCAGLRESYFAFGMGGIIGIFLFRIVPRGDADEWLWTIVGDLPPVYLDVVATKNAAEALTAYCILMRDWATAVNERRDLSEEYPVDAPPTPNNAKALLSRVDFLKKEFLPQLKRAARNPKGRKPRRRPALERASAGGKRARKK